MDIKNCILQRIFYPKVQPDETFPVFIIGEFISPEARKTFTGKGQILNPQKNQAYSLMGGNWEDNHFRGNKTSQFSFKFAQVETPTDPAGIYRYLCRYKFVGPAIAEQLVEKFGTEALNILKGTPSRAALQIKGLSKEKAVAIGEELRANEETESAIVALDALLGNVPGMPKNLAPRLVKEFGSAAPEMVRINPYVLTRIRGVGFLLADRVAIGTIKIPADSVFRKAAALRHVLDEQNQKGHTWAVLKDCLQQAYALISCDCTDGIAELLKKKEIAERPGMIARIDHDKAETLITGKLLALKQSPVTSPVEQVTCLICNGTGCPACNMIGKTVPDPVEDFI